MQRIVTSTDLGEGRIRWRVRIESDDCPMDMQEPHKLMLMQNLADNPSLLTCGMLPFQVLKMAHDGVKWIIEAEAVSERPNAKELRNSP
jgi:hypothetical protein